MLLLLVAAAHRSPVRPCHSPYLSLSRQFILLLVMGQFLSRTLAFLIPSSFRKPTMPTYDLWGKEVTLDLDKETFPTHDELKKMEDTMPGCEHGWFESSTTGSQLHYRKFIPPAGPLKGVVVFQHGIQTHSGKSFVLKNGRKVGTALMSAELNKNGYALYALDMQGHGYSEGVRHYVPNWKVNRDDLAEFGRFVANQHEEMPLFLMGHSYGSTVVLHVAETWQENTANNAPRNFKGIILGAPAIIGDVPPFPVTFTLRYLITPLAPKWTPFFMPNPVSPERIWSDPEVLARQTEKRYLEMGIEGSGKPFRLGTAVALLTSLEVVRSQVIPKLTIPFCVFHGTRDEGVPIEGTDFLKKTARTPDSDRSIHRLEGAFHDLFSEPSPTAEKTMEYAIQFMNQRVAKK
jgi:alpha-beta hydrolase superfamily lysophospholipase